MLETRVSLCIVFRRVAAKFHHEHGEIIPRLIYSHVIIHCARTFRRHKNNFHNASKCHAHFGININFLKIIYYF